MRWLRRDRRVHTDERVCAERGQGFAGGEKAYESTLDGVATSYWFHRECFMRGWGYDPETHEVIRRPPPPFR